MVLRNEGEKFSYMGKEFTIGDKVLATCESEYEGLVGEIIEIRDGEDKETDNDTPDIYCRFAEPVMAVNKEKLKIRFSDLWQQPMEIEDINLDQPIMAPDMIVPIDSLKNGKDKKEIYILVEDAAVDSNQTFLIEAFTDLDEAKKHLEIKLNAEMEEGMLLTPLDAEDFVIEENETFYEIYRKGRYCEWHYSVYITTLEMNVSDDFVEDVGTTHTNRVFAGDFECQVEDWEELAHLSSEECEEFLRNPDIPDRIREALRSDEIFMSEYFRVISEVAHKVVKEENL